MTTKAEARARLAVRTNRALPGKVADAALALVEEIQATRLASWSRVNLSRVVMESGLSREHLRALVRAMVGDGLVERHVGRPVATAQGYRLHVYLRSLVGDDPLDLIRALGAWEPDWRLYYQPRVRASRVRQTGGGRADPD